MFLLQQTFTPNQENTGTQQQFGWYSLTDFVTANWLYIIALVFIVGLFIYVNKKNKQ